MYSSVSPCARRHPPPCIYPFSYTCPCLPPCLHLRPRPRPRLRLRLRLGQEQLLMQLLIKLVVMVLMKILVQDEYITE